MVVVFTVGVEAGGGVEVEVEVEAMSRWARGLDSYLLRN